VVEEHRDDTTGIGQEGICILKGMPENNEHSAIPSGSKFCGDVVRGYRPQAVSTPGYCLASILDALDAIAMVSKYGSVVSANGA